ncbi:hypothetical protein ACP6PL_23365 [Dapis sp. BLCC M126]
MAKNFERTLENATAKINHFLTRLMLKILALANSNDSYITKVFKDTKLVL